MRCVGCAMDPKNDTNLPKTVEFYFFSDPHSTHNLLICQLQVHFSQEHSPAYLRLFVGTIEGRWGPQEVKKGQKWGKIACSGVNPYLKPISQSHCVHLVLVVLSVWSNSLPSDLTPK